MDNLLYETQSVTVKPPELSPSEISERSFDLFRLYQISQIRESAHPQFDGMGYSLYNETNEKADISYLAPRKNKGDSRITTGITHEKDSSLLSFLLNLNFEGNVRVFKGDKEMDDLGVALTRLVRKSREEEKYDEKRPQIYRNYIVQGTSFTREAYVETWVPDKQITGEIDPSRLDKVKWVDKGLKKISSMCETTLIDPKKVFLEDIRQPDIQKQPGVYTVEYVPRGLVEAVWGNMPRWKNVPYMVTPTAQSLAILTQGSIYSDFIFGPIDYNKVEVIMVYRPMEQRFQIYINGVPMLPDGFPLKAVSPKGIIPIAKGDLDLMNMFAYSKSEPAKTKIDQAVFDEVLQNMIVKFRQSAQVPRANNTGRILTPEMFLGGKLISNLDPKKAPPLIENPGITNADFSFYSLFKEQIDAKTLSSMFEGNQAPNTGSISLGQYVDMQKKQMMKIGGKIDGVRNWETQMLRLRTYDILAHGAQKDEKGNYKDISMTDILGSGAKGLAVTKFQEGVGTPGSENVLSPYQVFDQENQYKDENGVEAEFTYLDPTLMKDILENPDYCLYFEVIPVDKNNDKLTQMMFMKMISDAAMVFGMNSLKVDNLKKEYARLMGKTFDELFISQEQMQAQMQTAELNGQKPVTPQEPKPIDASMVTG